MSFEKQLTIILGQDVFERFMNVTNDIGSMGSAIEHLVGIYEEGHALPVLEAQNDEFEGLSFADLKANAAARGMTVPVGTSKVKLLEILRA